MAMKPVKPKVMAKPKPRPTKPVEKPKAPRGSKSAKQMGDMNAMENVRVNKYYKNIVSKAEVKGMKSEGKSQSKTFTNARGEKFGAKTSEVARARQAQRAGGGKNLGPMEKPKAKSRAVVSRAVQPAKPRRLMQRAKKK
jgi:hypothetical protein